MILDNHDLGYDAFNKMCAGINEITKKMMKGRSPNQIYCMVDSIGDLILIFGLNLVLSRGTHSNEFWTVKCFI